MTFYCLKLTSGDTLFSEVSDTTETHITLIDPFQIRNHDNESMSAVQWIPYCDDRHVIPISMVYYMNLLSPRFKKFYGGVVLQSKISMIKMDVAEQMSDRNDYYTMIEGIERIKTVAEEVSEKFGIENSVDTTDFEEQAEKYKPMMN